MNNPKKMFDAIIIGSGFGGSMIAKKLVENGWNVAMIERGDWVERGAENWAPTASLDLTPYHDKSQPYKVVKGGNKKYMGTYACVGGPSVFYGGVSFRFREADFHPPKEIIGASKARWPIDYGDLSPYYDEAEKVLNISGVAGIDPTEPKRMQDFPQKVGPYAAISQKIKTAAESLALHPYRLPLAINYEDTNRQICQSCTTCDTFACAIEAKNDLATVILKDLVRKGMTLLDGTLVTKLTPKQGKIEIVQCLDLKSNKNFSMQAKKVILSAGALGSPHLLLSSGLDALNPGGALIGRYLMRHANAITFGIFPIEANKENQFHKELAIMDYYFGHKDIMYPKHKIGSIQQVSTPPSKLIEQFAPKPMGKILGKCIKYSAGLLAIAEDQPQFKNNISIDKSNKSKFGMPNPIISHEYTKRDLAAVKILSKKAKAILQKTGFWIHYTHMIKTFSHAVGTVRMGEQPTLSVLDKYCQFRGLSNLFVVDASCFPTSAAVNPSLTISANALRVGDYLVEQATTVTNEKSKIVQ